MINWLRWIGIVFVWASCGLAMYRFCVLPAQCNVVEQQVQAITLKLAGAATDQVRLAANARHNLERLQSCLEHCPTVNGLMLAAVNDRLLGRYEEAIGQYRHALEMDRRPELYLNLGLAQIEAGQEDVGVENVVVACVYNPILLDDVSVHHDEVQRRLSLYQNRIEQLRSRRR